MVLSFERAIVALADSIVHARRSDLGQAKSTTEVSEFLLSVHYEMPDYLRTPFRWLVLLFDAWSLPTKGLPFHRLSPVDRLAQIESWRQSHIEFRRRFVEFYGSLAIFGMYSDLYDEEFRYDGHSDIENQE